MTGRHLREGGALARTMTWRTWRKCRYVDLHDNEIDVREWAQLLEQPGRVIAQDQVTQPDGTLVLVQTMWTGHDDELLGAAPWGTVLRVDATHPEPLAVLIEYPDRAQATRGHPIMVERVRQGLEPERNEDQDNDE